MKKEFKGFHGDLDFFKLNKLPKDAEFVGSFKQFVAAEGETTGHKHVITSKETFKVYKMKDRWLYLLKAPAEITHEEHKKRVIEPGIIFQDNELEESAQDGLVRRVVD